MYLRFIDEEETYVLENDFRTFGGNKICLYETTIPEKTNGFEIILDNGEVISFHDYNNIYSKTDEYIIFTSDTRIHHIYYIYDDEGYVISYSTTIKKLDKHNAILVRSGIGSRYEVVQIDEFLDENGLSKYKVVDGELETVTEDDLEYLYNRKLQRAKEEKIAELSYICGDNINKGVEFNGELFSYKLEDQNELATAIDAVKLSGGMPAPYHANGKGCKLYTAEEIVALYNKQVINLTHNKTYFNQLRGYVNTLKTIELVESVYYGQELTESFLDNYNMIMEHSRNMLAVATSV